jgi:signal transduction histidine kinase
MKNTLRNRLIFSFVTIFIIVMVFFTFATTRFITWQFNNMVFAAGTQYARRVAPLFSNYYFRFGSWEGVEDVMDSIMQIPPKPLDAPENELNALRDNLGYRFLISSRPDDERLILLDAENEIIIDTNPDGPSLSINEMVEKGIGIYVDRKRVGTVIAASSLGMLSTAQQRFLSSVRLLMFIGSFIGIIAVIIVGAYQAKKIADPVQDLATAALNVAKGDYSQRISTSSTIEIQEMSDAFNTMASELEKQHELRDRAMADIAHELRTPLSVLQIELEAMEDGLTELTPEAFGVLQSEVVHLKTLVEDLRMLSRAEAGELMIERHPLEITGFIKDFSRRVLSSAREKGIGLGLALPDTNIWVLADQQRIYQVFLNLVTNAIHHTSEGGQIILRLEKLDEKVRMSVQDTGEGIHPDDLPHIFDRFYRAESDRSRDSGGSGLGLSIARSFIEAHSGKIWVDSQLGVGTTMTFTLPLLKDHEMPTIEI